MRHACKLRPCLRSSAAPWGQPVVAQLLPSEPLADLLPRPALPCRPAVLPLLLPTRRAKKARMRVFQEEKKKKKKEEFAGW